jgi:hypothetical protein
MTSFPSSNPTFGNPDRGVEPVEGLARPTWLRRSVDGRVVLFTAPLNMSIPQAHSRGLASYLRPALATRDFSWTVR